MKKNILEDYKRSEDKILLAQILDKIELAQKRGKQTVSDFLDMYQIALVTNFLRKMEYSNYELFGGFQEAERKVIILEVEENPIQKIEELKAIRVQLIQEDFGKFTHRNYLGGVVKVGMKREKVGDILVSEEGADILVKQESAEILKRELETLTRFEKANLEIIELEDLRKPEIQREEMSIIVPSLRLDNFVSDLAKTSRSKAVQIINAERVFLNGQCETKVSKQVKIGDILTIRGKGRFTIKAITGTTRSGRSVVLIEKYGA